MKASGSQLPPQFGELAEIDPDLAAIFASEERELLIQVAAEACQWGGFDPKDAQYLLYSALFLRGIPNRNTYQPLIHQAINAIKSQMLVWRSRRHEAKNAPRSAKVRRGKERFVGRVPIAPIETYDNGQTPLVDLFAALAPDLSEVMLLWSAAPAAEREDVLEILRATASKAANP